MHLSEVMSVHLMEGQLEKEMEEGWLEKGCFHMFRISSFRKNRILHQML